MEQKDDKLKANYQYYLDNYDNLVKLYDGKVLLLVNRSVADICDSEVEAYEKGAITYGLGNFIFQRCSSQQKTYNTIIHSIVRK